MKLTGNTTLSATIASGASPGIWRTVRLALALSVPSVMAQLAVIVMQYIDAAMVGQMGADASAAVGLVTTSTWLFNGLCSATAAGFAVQVAHLLGARRAEDARGVVRQGLTAAMLLGLLWAAAGCLLSLRLPWWLGGTGHVAANASAYFFIYAAALPMLQLNFLMLGVLRSSGNMLAPGVAGAAMCLLDVVLNYFLIFPTREVVVAGMQVIMPGMGLGVRGAAVGTALAVTVTSLSLLVYVWHRRSELRMADTHGSFRPTRIVLRRAWSIGMPMAVERSVMSAAQIVLIAVVAPLGAVALAANALAVTAEGFCYMPGYGVSDAATALVGQSLGADNKPLARRLAYSCVGLGMATMSAAAMILYIGAPYIIGIMTPDPDVLSEGVKVVRTVAWVEPMFAVAIVCYGVFVGAGDTLVPCLMNFGSMWGVRIVLAAILAPLWGLWGVWLAMSAELCFRGTIFFLRLRSDRWTRRRLV